MHLRLSVPFVLLILTACGGGGGGKPSSGASSVPSNSSSAAVTASSETVQISSASESAAVSSQATQSASSEVVVAVSSASSAHSMVASSTDALSSVAASLSSEAATSSVYSSVEASSSVDASRSAVSSSLSSFPGVNVLSNGGLEDSTAGEADPVGWSTVLLHGAEAVFSVDETEQQSGSNALKIAISTLSADSQQDNIQASAGPMGVVAGASYQFSGWVKGNVGAEVQFAAGLLTYPDTLFAETSVILVGEWQRVILDINVSENANVIAASVNMNYGTNVGAEIYLDDFTLVGPPLEPATGETVMINGDLENTAVGDTRVASWRARAGNGSDAAFSVTDSEAHDGTKSLQVTVNELSSNDPNADDIQVEQAGFPVVEKSTFGFSGWIKGAAGTKADITVGLTESPYTEYGREDVVMTGDWLEVSIPFNVPEGGASVLRAVVDLNIAGNAGQVFYLDDFSAIFVE